MRKVNVVCVLILVLFVGSGCQPLANPNHHPQTNHPTAHKNILNAEKEELAQGLLGPGPMNYPGIEKQRSYPKQTQGYNGISNSNIGGNPTTVDDKVLMKRIVEEHTKYHADFIFFMGSHAYVYLDIPEDAKEEDKDKQIDELKKALRREKPTYQYHIQEKRQ
ncbi:hypothetical protein [Alkalihalobacillus pseudalcaliphilus]|uniref:hypothetical protein n=1 Tax=Alkalihalobacillus pseudalcaliphilus TaxID=79884 RepID=UPI00235F0456|nr:hypothetical protein [Alkalihalobacillus pseudalcaliphilus]